MATSPTPALGSGCHCRSQKILVGAILPGQRRKELLDARHCAPGKFLGVNGVETILHGREPLKQDVGIESQMLPVQLVPHGRDLGCHLVEVLAGSLHDVRWPQGCTPVSLQQPDAHGVLPLFCRQPSKQVAKGRSFGEGVCQTHVEILREGLHSFCGLEALRRRPRHSRSHSTGHACWLRLFPGRTRFHCDLGRKQGLNVVATHTSVISCVSPRRNARFASAPARRCSQISWTRRSRRWSSWQ